MNWSEIIRAFKFLLQMNSIASGSEESSSNAWTSCVSSDLNIFTPNDWHLLWVGAETQRINLTRTLGSNLTNSLLHSGRTQCRLHPVDSNKTDRSAEGIADLGNTVVIVETRGRNHTRIRLYYRYRARRRNTRRSCRICRQFWRIHSTTQIRLTAAYIQGEKELKYLPGEESGPTKSWLKVHT